MADQGDSLLREVDDALRSDRMAALWKLYRRPVIFAVAVIILGTLGNAQYHNYRETRAGVAMQEITAAQQLFAQQKFDEAATKFAAIASTHRGDELADMAHLWQARALLAVKKTPEAIAVLADLAEHPQSSQLIWRDNACLRLVALDAGKTACLEATDGSPLAAQRTLVRAAVLWSDQKPDAAQKLLQALVDSSETPASVREHAKRYLSVIAPAKPPVTLKKGA